MSEIDGLKETEKQYAKIRGVTTGGTQNNVCDYWLIMRKYELGILRDIGFGMYAMYSIKEDMKRFVELVTTDLNARTGRKYDEYVDALRMFQKAEIAASKLQEGGLRT
jgi:hypothetical protein